MMTNGTMDDQTATRASRWKRRSLILPGGLLIGLAASLPLAVVLPYPSMPNINFCVNGGEGTYFGAMILSFRVHFTLPVQFSCLAIVLFAKPLMWLSFFV